MFSILTRFGLLILAGVILFLALRLHNKSGGKGEKAAKAIATLGAFTAGLAMLGTFVGDWMGSVSAASPYIAGAGFLLSFGGLAIDWWRDGKPDKFAFWCALMLPIMTIYGWSQMGNIGDLIGRNADQVSVTVDKAAR